MSTRITLALLFLGAFIGLGLAVRAEPPPALDADGSEAAQAAFGGGMHDALFVSTRALYRPWNWPATALLALVAGLARGWRAALLVLVCSVATLLAVHGGKLAYGRLRPPDPAVVAAERSTRSYPSGHVAWTAATLGAFAVAVTRRRTTRVAALSVVGLLTIWMAMSRVHLGRHYPSDTLGAVLLSASVLLLTDALMFGMTGREARRPPPTRL